MIAEVAEHVRQEEKAMVATDASVWAVSTWNVDKNANTIPNFARSDEVSVVPPVTDVLCVTEAQKFVPGTTRRPPTMFRQSTWTSSTIGATQVLVRYPHTLVEEVDVGVFPHTFLDSPDDGVDIDDEESTDSAEIQFVGFATAELLGNWLRLKLLEAMVLQTSSSFVLYIYLHARVSVVLKNL